MENKKNFLLATGIIEIVFGVLSIVICILSLLPIFAILSVASSAGAEIPAEFMGSLTILIGILSLCLAVPFIVGGAFAIRASRLPVEAYAQKAGGTLGFAIFEIVFIAFSVINMFTSFNFFVFIQILVIVLVIVFRFLVRKDMIRIASNDYSNVNINESAANMQPNNSDSIGTVELLEKLTKLRDSGAISEEEFQTEKAKIIGNF